MAPSHSSTRLGISLAATWLAILFLLAFGAQAARAQEPAATPQPAATLPMTVTHVDVGYGHVCAALGDAAGRVQCWGANWLGQLGNAAQTNTPLPVDAPISGTVELAAGAGFTCARLRDGTVRCWGDNSFGQHGDGSGGTGMIDPLPSGQPTRALLPGPAIDLTAGGGHACAVLAGGDVYCWGSEFYGTAGSPVPIQIPGLKAREVAAGVDFVCARRTDDAVVCWGSNERGQLGTGSAGGSSTAPVPVSGIVTATTIDAGGYAGCAVVKQGANSHVRCWGLPDWPPTTLTPTVAIPVSGTVGAVDVAVGAVTCAQMETGRVRCWGNNDRSGLLGVGHGGWVTGTVEVVGLEDVAALAAGPEAFCALRANGRLWCWGRNFYGELGVGYAGWGDPTAVPGLEGSDEVRVGGGTCARRDGAVFCWGSGAPRTPAAPYAHQPAPVPGLPGGATQLALSSQGCAVVGDTGTGGAVWCWGNNIYGMAGQPFPPPPTPARPAPAAPAAPDGDAAAPDPAPATQDLAPAATAPTVDPTPTSFVLTATQVAGLPPAVEVRTGGYHTCARTAAGEVWCWGNPWFGALGDGSTGHRYTPKRVAGVSHATHLAAGTYYSCAVVRGRELWCWGTYDLGLGAQPPTRLFAWDGIDQVDLTGTLACVRAGGEVRGVGSPGFNLRLPPWQDGLPPILPGTHDVRDVACGGGYLCVVQDDAVWCMGFNIAGQVADDAPEQALTLWRVAGTEGAVDVAASGAHTCARLGDGRLLCWGTMDGGVRGVNPGWLAAPVQGLGAPTVFGRVLDAWGFTLLSARVMSEGITVRVDEQGEYALPGLPAGTHTLRAFEPTYAFVPAARSVQTPSTSAVRFTGTPSPLYRVHLPLLATAR